MNEATDAPGDAMDTSDDARQWLSVGEAAKRLGMSERHVRRMTSRLSDHDRTRTHGGPLRVRLDALERLRDEGPAQSTRPDTDVPDMDTAPPVTGHGQRPDTDTTEASEKQAVSRSAGDAELIEQLRADLDYMKTALANEQENTRAALAELSRAREQSAVLLAAVGASRLQINAATSASTATEPEANADTGELQKAAQAAAHENATGGSENDTTGSQTRVGWFARFLGRGK